MRIVQKKDINYCLKKVIADGKSDAKSVIRNFRITADGSTYGGGGVKDDSV